MLLGSPGPWTHAPNTPPRVLPAVQLFAGGRALKAADVQSDDDEEGREDGEGGQLSDDELQSGSGSEDEDEGSGSEDEDEEEEVGRGRRAGGDGRRAWEQAAGSTRSACRGRAQLLRS